MIAFRVDSSTQIGSGHVMRCLTLAEKLNCKEKIIFISRDLQGNINNLVLKKDFKLILLKNKDLDLNLKGYEKWLTVRQEQDAKETIETINKLNIELLIVDSYAIDEKWEKMLRPYVKKIMVIDDLANRKHDCDILLDQNFYCDMDIRYKDLVPKECRILLGQNYSLLRNEFYDFKEKQKKRDGIIKNILVFFGGSDISNETMKTLKAIYKMQLNDIEINVVVGASNDNKKQIEIFCDKKKYNFFCQVNNMAELINKADLAIGAGGTSTWERCFLGLPSIVIAIAENQIRIAEDCDSIGILKYIGTAKESSVEMIIESILFLIKNKEQYKLMQNRIEKFFLKDYNFFKNEFGEFCENIVFGK